jgi:hypothetical protein
VHEMREQLLIALEPQERELFMELLRKFVHVNNEQSRAPMQVPESPVAKRNQGTRAA